MAYDNSSYSRDEEEDDQRVDPGAAAAGVGAGTGGFGAPAQKQGGGSTGFVNFDRYFATNARAAEGMANTATSPARMKAEGALGQMESVYGAPKSKDGSTGQSMFTNAIQKGSTYGKASRPPDHPWAGGRAPELERPSPDRETGGQMDEKMQQAYGMSVTMPDDPAKKDPKPVGSQVTKGAYTGPQSAESWSGFNDLRARFEGAQAAVKNAGNPTTIQTNFAAMNKQAPGTYNTGMSRFDASLAARGGPDVFKRLQERYGGMSGTLDNKVAGTNQQIAAAQKAVDYSNWAAQQQADRMTEEERLEYESRLRERERG